MALSPLRIAALRRPFQRAVEKQRAEIVVPRGPVATCSGPPLLHEPMGIVLGKPLDLRVCWNPANRQ